MVMTCHHAPSTAHLVLLALLIVTPRLAGTAPARGEGGEAWTEGRTRTDRKEDSVAPLLSSPLLQALSSPDNVSLERGRAPGGDNQLDKVTDPVQVLAVLLEALDHPGEGKSQAAGRSRDWDGDQSKQPPSAEGSEGGEIRQEGESEAGRLAEAEGKGADKAIEQLIVGHLTAALRDEAEERDEGDKGTWSQREEGRSAGDAGPDSAGGEEGEGDGVEPQGEGNDLERFLSKAMSGSASQGEDPSLQRKIRGYFQNIDLGLQDNEILPPLKGYKAYNTQLARAGKKLHWQENRPGDRPVKGGNFMDDFEDEGEELEEEVEEEEETLSHMEEEARARAEKQEVLRQQEEAERAREEEQRLADIASDMLLQYMGKKQQAYMKPRQKSSMGAAGNTAEDKRSEEVLHDDDDDLDQQMIDRLIEISSKLHLPADDVVEIISDMEEKKKKRKELLLQPTNSNPIAPRFRPLVPPPLAAPPIYHYTASKNPKKAPYKYNKSNKKWHKDKVKSYKQDYWYKPQKQVDYWYKPQKQFLAFPSYPYYQKPYRAYYPVYFPYPKADYYGKPASPRDQPFGPQELDLQPPRRRHRDRAGGKNRGQGWRQQQAPRLPLTPYISNYILPHPRTYQPLPPPKPISPPRRGRRPPYYYPQVTPGDDYEEDGLVPQLDSEEELENFIERIYMKRRMY